MQTTFDNIKPNVVIVDSGIDRNNKTLKSKVIGGITFNYNFDKNEISIEHQYHDDNGHGTFCAEIINKIAADVGIYVVKILNKQKKTNSLTLIESLKHLLEIDIRVINLSLATIDEKYKDDLEGICNKLYNQGKIIICSLDNRNSRSFPAIFKHVIGVRGSLFSSPNHFWFNKDYDIQCVADGNPILVSKTNDSYSFFSGNSKATALFTGVVLNILKHNSNISFEKLNDLLENFSAKKYWSENDLSLDLKPFEGIEHPKNKINKHELKILENILIKTLNIEENHIPLLYRNKLYHPKLGLNPNNLYSLLNRIEKDFDKKLNYEQIDINIFNSIFSLLDFVLGGDYCLNKQTKKT